MPRPSTCAYAVLLVLTALPALGQDFPKVEIFGGYSHFSATILGESFNGNGGVGSIAINPKPWLGGVGEFGVYHSSLTLPSGSSTDLTFLFGPKVAARGNGRLTLFGQALFGGMRVGAFQVGAQGVSNTAFAMDFGGGADVKLNNTMAIRLVQADWLRTHFHGNSTLDNWQNIPRFSAGIVVRLSGQ